ncbi:recombinase family protein [Solidesulfovibrio magneticus]|nr:recombinase family protein [Solidesulfovibrio magneticus]
MAIFAYLRVSTLDQAESGAGLAAQLDACRRFAKSQEAELTAVFEDRGISGSKGLEARPGLLDAVATMGKGDVLLVAKRDRLGRDPIQVALIERAVSRKGARIVSAAGEGTDGDDPASILMRRMVDAFAEYERLLIGARTKSAMGAMKRRGERVGQIPYGYSLATDGVKLIPVSAEQEVIAEARRLHGAGLSLRGIAKELEARGFASRSGKAFLAEQVKRLLAA